VENIVNALQFVANICLKTAYNPLPLSLALVSIQGSGVGTRCPLGIGDNGEFFIPTPYSLLPTPKVGILFYRSLPSWNTAPIDALCQAFAQDTLIPIYLFPARPRCAS